MHVPLPGPVPIASASIPLYRVILVEKVGSDSEQRFFVTADLFGRDNSFFLVKSSISNAKAIKSKRNFLLILSILIDRYMLRIDILKDLQLCYSCKVVKSKRDG